MESNASTDAGVDIALLQGLQTANPRFQLRAPQWQIVRAVDAALIGSGLHAIFADPVAGQSFALLLAALKCSQRVVISVASVALQHKLRELDWPQIRAATQTSKRLAVVSSRRNQLCPQRLQQQCGRRDTGEQAQALLQWHMRSASRDLSQCPLLRDDDAILARVSCSGTRCEAAHCAHDDYHTADIVIVTHAWLLSQKNLPKSFAGCRLIVDDVHHWFGAALERDAQTLDIAFWIGQSTAFETWQGKHLPLETATLRPYLKHIVAVASALNRSDGIEGVLASLRNAVETFLQAFNHLISVRGIRIVEHSPWLEYCHWYLQWHQHYAQHNDSRYGIVRQQVRNVSTWVCRIDSDGDVEAYLRPLQSFAASVFSCAGGQHKQILPLALQQRVLSTGSVDGAPLWHHQSQESRSQENQSPKNRLRLQLLPTLAADIDESSRMQAATAHLLDRFHSGDGRWLLLVTQRAQIDRFRALMPQHERILWQGDQPKTVLLKRFSAMPQGILVATWQMIDGWDFGDAGIRGAVLDRMPLTAGAGALTPASRDKASFVKTALPQAQKVMVRIAGMLVRREWQASVLVLADTRLLTHAYAETIMAPLPPLEQ